MRYFDLDNLYPQPDDNSVQPSETNLAPSPAPAEKNESPLPGKSEKQSLYNGILPRSPRKPSNKETVNVRNIDRTLADPIREEFSEAAGFQVSYKDMLNALMLIYLQKNPRPSDSHLRPLVDKFAFPNTALQYDLSAVSDQLNELRKDNAVLRRLLLSFMDQMQAVPDISYANLDMMEKKLEEEKTEYLKKSSVQKGLQFWETANRKNKKAGSN